MYPIKIQVDIDGNTYVLESQGKDDYTVRMPSGLNWEGIADVYKDDTKIGSGFIESNNLLKDETYLSNGLSTIKLKKGVVYTNHTTFARFICILYILFILLSIIFLIYFLVKYK